MKTHIVSRLCSCLFAAVEGKAIAKELHVPRPTSRKEWEEMTVAGLNEFNTRENEALELLGRPEESADMEIPFRHVHFNV